MKLRSFVPIVLTSNVLLKDVVDHRIDVLIAVLEEDGKTVLDRHFQMLEKVTVVKSQDFQVVLLLALLDPFQGLLLRIDAVGRAARLRGQYPILYRQLIRRQTFTRPFGDFHVARQQFV